MIRRSLGMFALAAVTSLVTACSSGASSEEGSPSDSSEGALATNQSQLTLRYEGTDLGILLFRLNVSGNKVTGHAVPKPYDDYNSFSRGEVTGTTDGHGKFTFTWQIPNFSPKPTFEGTLANDKLDGTITVQGVPSFAATMSTIKPGTLENGRPVSFLFGNQEKIGDCSASYTGFEVVGLPNQDLERSIAAKVDDAAKKAVAACKGSINYVQGGLSRGVVRKDIISFTSGVYADDGGPTWKYTFGERGTYEIATGRELSLFGDVIQPGKEAELAAALEHAIDTLDTYSVDANEKQKLKDAMLSPAGKAKLPKTFALNDRGVSFAAEDYNTPKLHGVTVKYSDLTAILAPNGKAKSAWNP